MEAGDPEKASVAILGDLGEEISDLIIFWRPSRLVGVEVGWKDLRMIPRCWVAAAVGDPDYWEGDGAAYAPTMPRLRDFNLLFGTQLLCQAKLEGQWGLPLCRGGGISKNVSISLLIAEWHYQGQSGETAKGWRLPSAATSDLLLSQLAQPHTCWPWDQQQDMGHPSCANFPARQAQVLEPGHIPSIWCSHPSTGRPGRVEEVSNKLS